jgi:hypothetical protein
MSGITLPTFVLTALFLMLMTPHITELSPKATNTAEAQTMNAEITPTNRFGLEGQIGSLVLGMPPNTKTVDMTTVPKFILSGDWSMNVEQGNLTNFNASFYTGPVNGADNHTHQLGNFRVDNSSPIQLSSNKSVSLSGILDLGTNGKEAWNDVNATVDISKGRSISIELADEDTERHFMGQQIYGIVERLII